MIALAFTTPWLLLGLLALPVLWLLLRAVPPAPIRRRFPGVALLLGLGDEDREADTTPWWLLVLRMAAVAAVIVAFAGPVLNPRAQTPGTGPLLVLLDGGWADARDWPRRIDRAVALVEAAGRDGRVVAVARLTDPPQRPVFQGAGAWAGRVAALAPAPWRPSMDWIAALPEGDFDTVWLSDGLAQDGQGALARALQARGRLTVVTSQRPVLALAPPEFADGAVQVSVARVPAGAAVQVDVAARGPDPSGIDRELARLPLAFGQGAEVAEGALALPPELRNRIKRFEIVGQRSAGAVSLTDDRLKRRKIALIGGGADREGLQLLSPTHFLRQALAPVADLIDGGLADVLPANPDVIVLADVARLGPAEADGVLDWLERGGLLVRFAGPRLAASDVGRRSEDPLMPVRLREGGRAVGGAMSWGEPKALAAFPAGSPFHGLAIPSDVTVSAQVLAQPDPDLSARTIAALADGTPLVTRKAVGQGQVVLVHVTANAAWSTLPLSGLFVQMLERLAVSSRVGAATRDDLAGQVWVPQVLLDGFGAARVAGTGAGTGGGVSGAGVSGEALAAALQGGPGAAVPPGLYAGSDRQVALNALGSVTGLRAAQWPLGTATEALEGAREQGLTGAFLAGGVVLLTLDILAALWLSGKLSGLARVGVVALAGLAALGTGEARAQDDARANLATQAVVLAHVLTGNARVDADADAGLRGLGDQLFLRTSVEPDLPLGVDIETDELAFYPFLYWPVTPAQALPSAQAYARLNTYLRTGGMILFDTRDGDIAGGGATPEAQALQRLAAGLDIPPLEPMPPDHVLSRTFFLLQDYPGRYAGRTLWVEAAPPDAEQVEGMPFRNLNDGVTPVIFGGNDWAAAWAVDQNGVPIYPVGRGAAGEQQRELAYRFGINVIMHVLTGNYKSDQVHVPALLERLGQ